MQADLMLADYVESERDRIVGVLFDCLRIPSISADPSRSASVRHSAEFAADLLRGAGMDHAEIVDTGGAPAVYADWL
ncbi:MAG: peptidase M20, partial [Actinobacteria bacterium]|nr:peptidase M20 [Actinomycetota bacterium]